MEATHTHPLEGISVVLPLYNEEENITSVFTELSDVLQGLGRLHEIICVNDGSTDGSKVELEKQARISESDIKLIHFEQNRGQRAAFAAGFENARFPLVVTMNADGQNDPADIPRLLEGLTDADGARTVSCRTGRTRRTSRKGRFGRCDRKVLMVVPPVVRSLPGGWRGNGGRRKCGCGAVRWFRGGCRGRRGGRGRG